MFPGFVCKHNVTAAAGDMYSHVWEFRILQAMYVFFSLLNTHTKIFCIFLYCKSFEKRISPIKYIKMNIYYFITNAHYLATNST